MSAAEIATPPVVSHEEWLAARKAFLAEEKEFTRLRDAHVARRRRLPMVKVEKDYIFQGPSGTVRLEDLFEGRRQLIIYHFMFDPRDGDEPPFNEGCPGCSFVIDHVGPLAHLHARDTSFVAVSRAPMEKITPFKKRMGWTVPWVSSFGSDFNYDFHTTVDESIAPAMYNFDDKAALAAKGKDEDLGGEHHGVSCFLRTPHGIFHTYSAYSRGVEQFMSTFQWLDITAYGRQEEWEDSPEGWPQTPTFGWMRHKDRYEAGVPAHSCC